MEEAEFGRPCAIFDFYGTGKWAVIKVFKIFFGKKFNLYPLRSNFGDFNEKTINFGVKIVFLDCNSSAYKHLMWIYNDNRPAGRGGVSKWRHNMWIVLKESGLGGECASFPEAMHALSVGFSAHQVVFDSPCKTKVNKIRKHHYSKLLSNKTQKLDLHTLESIHCNLFRKIR